MHFSRFATQTLIEQNRCQNKILIWFLNLLFFTNDLLIFTYQPPPDFYIKYEDLGLGCKKNQISETFWKAFSLLLKGKLNTSTKNHKTLKSHFKAKGPCQNDQGLFNLNWLWKPFFGLILIKFGFSYRKLKSSGFLGKICFVPFPVAVLCQSCSNMPPNKR